MIHEIFSQEHAAALRGVDLRIVGVVHGSVHDVVGHGPAVVGPTDDNYRTVAAACSDLNAERGDRVAYEEAAYTTPSSPTETFNRLLTRAHRSKRHIDEGVFNGVWADRNTERQLRLDEHTYISIDGLGALLQELADYRVIDPVDYAAGLALMAAVPTVKVDVSREEMEEWEAAVTALSKQESILGRLALTRRTIFDRLWLDAEFRERQMVRRLGATAADMVAQAGAKTGAGAKERPVLLYVVGQGHVPDARKFLTRQDIPAIYLGRSLGIIPQLADRFVFPISRWKWRANRRHNERHPA